MRAVVGLNRSSRVLNLGLPRRLTCSEGVSAYQHASATTQAQTHVKSWSTSSIRACRCLMDSSDWRYFWRYIPRCFHRRATCGAVTGLCLSCAQKCRSRNPFPSEPLPVLEPAKAFRYFRAATIMLQQRPCRKSLVAVQSLHHSPRGFSTRHVTAFLRVEVRCDSHHVKEALALLPHSPAAPGPPPPGSRPCQRAWATRPGRRCGPFRHPPPALLPARPLLQALPLQLSCWGSLGCLAHQSACAMQSLGIVAHVNTHQIEV